MEKSEHPESGRYERGRITNRYLRDRLRRYEDERDEESLEETLLCTYLDYQVKKRLFQYLIAGINGRDALGHLVHVVVQLAFNVLLSQKRDELEDSLQIRTDFTVTPEYGSSTVQSTLGSLDLGVSSALGSAAADAGTVACIAVDLSASQLSRLYDHPWTLRHILRAFDTVIPIDFDFRIRFRLRPREGSFLLVSHSDENTPMLGMTTTLAG